MAITGDLKETARRELLASGAVAAGFAEAAGVDPTVSGDFIRWVEEGNNAGMDYLCRHIPLREHPSHVLEEVATVICVAFSYLPATHRASSLPSISAYAYGDDYHDVLRRHLLPAVGSLKEQFGGEWRICVDTAPLPERYWALKSGIGIRGKNGSVIVEGAGCYAFLAEILTTVPFEADEASTGVCHGCGACLSACPGNALRPDGTIDSRRCLSYLTIEHRGDWTGDSLDVMRTKAGHHTLYGCDACLRVCPHNREALGRGASILPEFAARPEILTLTAEQAASMTQAEFSAMFKGSAIKRAKLSGLQRNALNALDGSPSEDRGSQ